MFNELSQLYAVSYQPTGVDSASDILGIAANVIMSITFSAGFVALAYGLFQVVISKGDSKNLDTAMKIIKGAIFAILLSIFAFTIKNILLNLLGVTDPQLTSDQPEF